MNFDGYGATLREYELKHVVDTLSSSLDGMASRGRPMRRYGEVINIEAGNRTAAWIGFDLAADSIYIEAKGETTPMVVNALRTHFPDHTAPRIDVKEDYDGEDAFERLQAIVRKNKGPRVKGGYVALPDDVQDGKTWAAGARGGVGYIRVYEAGKHPDRVHLARPNWVRAELECRPHYARDKAAAARMSPAEVWGLSSWTHRVGEALTEISLPRFEPEVRKYGYDKTSRYIFTTFRRHFSEMLENGEDIKRTMQAIWQEEDEYAKRRR